MGAGKDNQNAKKEVKADKFLHIRVTSKQKEGWIKTAQKEGKGLSEWVISKLTGSNSQK